MSLMARTFDRVGFGKVSILNVGTVKGDVNLQNPIPCHDLAGKAVG